MTEYHGAIMISFQAFTANQAAEIKLVLCDVDDTLTVYNGEIPEEVKVTLRKLMNEGILVGLVSGRDMDSLDRSAAEIKLNGPLVAENGGQFRFSPDSVSIFSGHQEIVLQALDSAKLILGDALYYGDWNRQRLTDCIIGCRGISIDFMRQLIEGVDLIETTYRWEDYSLVHVAQKGINKSRAVSLIIPEIGDGAITPENVIFLGDGPNDLPVFRSLPNTILVPNPRLSNRQTVELVNAARYWAEYPGVSGTLAALEQILKLRSPELSLVSII